MYNQAQPTAMYYNQYTQEVTQGQAPMPQPTMPGVHPNYQPNQFTGQQQHVYQQQNYMQVQYMQYQQQWQGQWQQVQWTQGQPGQTQPNNYYQQPQQFNQQQMGQVTPMYQSCTLDQVLNLMGFAHLGRHERLSIDKFVTAHVDMPGQPHVAYVMHEKWNATRQQSERVRVYEPSAIPLVQKLVTQELLQKGLVQPMTMQPMPQQMQPKWPPTQQSAQCAIGPSQGAIGPNHTTGQQTTPKTAFAQQNGLDRHAKPFNPVNGPDLSLLGTTPTNEPATDAAADFGDPSSMTALDEALPAIVESPERNGLTRETSMSDPRDHPLASELRDRGSTPFTEDLDSAVTMADEDASTPMSAPLMPPNPTTKEAR